ncbi:MAG: hypothetical protein EP346_14310 [Bacteroidetes bacterium]|nr:MAG: hypothetical protein EP346_14310 [Bacteroidota bacterium]
MIDRIYLKSLIEADLLHADSCLKELKYSNWEEDYKRVITLFLEERKRQAEHHLKEVNNLRDTAPTKVPALPDADG